MCQFGKTKLTLNYTPEIELGEFAYYIRSFFLNNMLAYQAEVRPGWQLMCNCKCNEICWLWQPAAPAAAPHIHMHTRNQTHMHGHSTLAVSSWQKAAVAAETWQGLNLSHLPLSFSLCCSPCLSQRSIHTQTVYCCQQCVCVSISFKSFTPLCLKNKCL